MSAGARFTTVRRGGSSRWELLPPPRLPAPRPRRPARRSALSPASLSVYRGRVSVLQARLFGNAKYLSIPSRGRSLSMFPSVSCAVGRAAALTVTILLLASPTAAAAPAGATVKGDAQARRELHGAYAQ